MQIATLIENSIMSMSLRCCNDWMPTCYYNYFWLWNVIQCTYILHVSLCITPLAIINDQVADLRASNWFWCLMLIHGVICLRENSLCIEMLSQFKSLFCFLEHFVLEIFHLWKHFFPSNINGVFFSIWLLMYFFKLISRYKM